MTNELMLRDITSQGEALAEGLKSLRAQVAATTIFPPDRVVLTGSGDSFIAAVALRSLFQDLCPFPVLALSSLDASRYLGVRPGDLVVIVSVSGEVARTIEAARASAAAGAYTVAVTAAGSSTLSRACDMTLTIPTPIDRSIPHSRDYTVTLLALACCLEGLIGRTLEELDGLPDVVADVVARSLIALEHIPSCRGRTWFLGAGPDRGTAMFGALKYWEAAGVEAWWDDLEEFAHGSQLMARPGDRAVLIACGPGVQRAHEMAPGLERMGLDIVLVGGPELTLAGHRHLLTTERPDPRWHPFASCIPAQVLAYFEAEMRGLDVTIPLFGQSFGPAYDEVHVEWTKKSQIVVGGGPQR